MIITGNIYCLPSNDEGGNRALQRSLNQMDKDRMEYEKKYDNTNVRLSTRKCRGCNERFPLDTMWWHEQKNTGYTQRLYHCEECKEKKPDKIWFKASECHDM